MKKILLRSAVTLVFIVLDILLSMFTSPAFFMISSLIFGAMYGGTAAAVVIIGSYILKPDSGYIILILMTIVMFLKGILISAVWKLITNRKQLIYQISAGITALLILISAILTYTEIFYTGIVVIFTLIFLFSDIFIKKISNSEKSGEFIKTYFCIAVAAVISKSLELIAYYDNFDIKIVSSALIQTLGISIIQSYLITLILNVYKKIKKSPV